MILLCKSCHDKNGEEIFNLIRETRFGVDVKDERTDEKCTLFSLNAENEKLKDELRTIKNQLVSAQRWIVDITRDKDKDGTEDEQKPKLRNYFGC